MRLSYDSKIEMVQLCIIHVHNYDPYSAKWQENPASSYCILVEKFGQLLDKLAMLCLPKSLIVNNTYMV